MDNPSILIIEDDVPLLQLYSKVLSAYHYQVAQADNMDQARNHLMNKTFDLLLADVQMGSERSTDLIRDLRDLLFESGTRVILMSAEEKFRTLRDELQLDVFVVKPVGPSDLVSLVDHYLPAD